MPKVKNKIFLNSTLSHWGRVTHIYVSKLTIIGSENGLSPGRRQTIIWTNAGILLIRTPGTNFSEIISEMHAFSFKKMHLKMSSGKWRPFCPGLNELTCYRFTTFTSFSDTLALYVFLNTHWLMCESRSVIALQLTIFRISWSYLVQLLTSVRARILLIKLSPS